MNFIFSELNDLYMTGRYKNLSISSFVKIKEPVPSATIIQVCISDDDDVYLLTDKGFVYKSENMKSVNEITFEQVVFPGNDEKVIKIAAGINFMSIMTDNGRCYSLLNDDKTVLVESGKLRELNVIDINAGAQHVLVSTIMRNEDDENGNGSEEPVLNQTYTINFQKITEMGSGVDNYQEPCEKEDVCALKPHEDDYKNDDISLIEVEDSIRGNNGSRATTLECKDTESSNHSSAHRNSSERPNSTILFIDNGIEKLLKTSPPLGHFKNLFTFF